MPRTGDRQMSSTERLGTSSSKGWKRDMSEATSRDASDLDTPRGFMAYGVTTFAGVILAMVSSWQIVEAIAAIANDTVFVRGLSYTWELDVTTWGWIHLVIGLIGLGTAIGILMGQTWG